MTSCFLCGPFDRIPSAITCPWTVTLWKYHEHKMNQAKVHFGGSTHHVNKNWQSKHSAKGAREVYLASDHLSHSSHAGGYQCSLMQYFSIGKQILCLLFSVSIKKGIMKKKCRNVLYEGTCKDWVISHLLLEFLKSHIFPNKHVFTQYLSCFFQSEKCRS